MTAICKNQKRYIASSKKFLNVIIDEAFAGDVSQKDRLPQIAAWEQNLFTFNA